MGRKGGWGRRDRERGGWGEIGGEGREGGDGEGQKGKVRTYDKKIEHTKSRAKMAFKKTKKKLN
jgi:hypothetical protein